MVTYKDEFVLVTYHERDDNDWSMNTKVYDITESTNSFSIVPKAEKKIIFIKMISLILGTISIILLLLLEILRIIR